MRFILALLALAVILAATPAAAQQAAKNASSDPEHIFFTEPVQSPVTVVTEPVPGSEFPLQLIYVQTLDGLYAPIGLRKPAGNGPFPVIVFARMEEAAKS